jgi:hypothetical protein
MENVNQPLAESENYPHPLSCWKVISEDSAKTFIQDPTRFASLPPEKPREEIQVRSSIFRAVRKYV